MAPPSPHACILWLGCPKPRTGARACCASYEPRLHAALSSNFVHADTTERQYNTNFTHIEAGGKRVTAVGVAVLKRTV